MNKKQHITQAATPRLTTFALASVAAFAAVQSVSAGVSNPADWYQSPDWNLDVALVGDSVSAFSDGQAALEVFSGNATIAETGSWTGLELEDPLAIAFAEYGMLALGGDLTVTTDYQDEEDAFLSGAVGFFNGGILSGDGNITITSNSQNSVAPLVLAGVYSNDIGGAVDDAVESEGGFESGSLDISGYSGAIVVTNDNSVGPATVGDGTELPIPLPLPIDIDLTKSAVAVGIAAVESNDGLDLGTVYGSLDQVVTTTAKSRNAEAFVSGEEEGEPNTDAVTAAAAVGALGYFNDGVGSTANITTAATSGSAVSDTEFDTANALTIGLAVGLGGVVEGIEQGATITTTANSGFAQATSDDDIAFSNTVAIAAGVVGLVYAPLDEEPDAVESDDPAVTTIATTATSSTSSVAAAGPAEAASGAIAVGMGGLIEDLSNTTLTTTATSGAVTAESSFSDAAALSISAAIGVIGEVGDVDGTTITSTATSAAASATDSDYAGATTLSVAGGILGYMDAETADLAIDATATAADAIAEGSYSAAASADAVAFGIADFEILFYALESVGPIFGDFFLGDILGDGLGSFLGDAVVADAPAGPPLPVAQTIALDLGVTANAKNATATIVFSEDPEDPEAPVESDGYGEGSTYASASALAVGAPDLGAGDAPVPTEISGTVDVTANAAIATASGDGYSEAAAYASAYGLDDVDGNLDATITVAANAGTASATSTYYSAEAYADADAEATSDVYGDLAGTVSATATAGTATATSSNSGSNANAEADATGVDGDLEGSSTAAITAIANGGSAAANSGEFEDWNSGYETSAYASGSADATGIDGTVTPLGYEPEVESDDAEVPTIGGSITVLADAGDAESDSIYLDGANADANASAQATGIYADEHDFVADLNAIIDIDALGGEADAYASNNAYADASANAQVIGDVEDIESNIAGTIDADAVAGYASASGNAGAEAYAAATSTLITGGKYDVNINHTATTTLNATGGYASATASGLSVADEVESDVPESTIIYADADAFTGGFLDFSAIDGDIGGSLTQTSLAGQAYANATSQRRLVLPNDAVEAISIYGSEVEASAVAEALGIDGDVYGEVSAAISLTAGAAIVRDLAPGDAVEGSEVESLSLPFSPVAVAVAYNGFGGEAHADASAYTTGINGNVYGNEGNDALSGSFTQNAFGGIAIAGSYDDFFIVNMDAIESNELEEEFDISDYYDVTASAVGDSFGVDGDVEGDVTADFTINATGGEAYASGNPSQTLAAEAYGDAAGIYGSVDGDFDATMNVTATGGKAIVETVNSMYQVIQVSSPDGLFADASAIATGIGGADANAIDGNVAGTINVTATGGEAGSLIDNFFDFDDAVESVVFIEEYFDGLYVAEGAYNAYAQAVGLNGNVDAEEVSAAITATATGGEVVIADTVVPIDAVEGIGFYDGSAGAFAAGIAGQEVIIDDVTGDITATATAGTVGYASGLFVDTDAVEGDGYYLPYVPDLAFADYADADYAFAAGIMTYTPYAEIDDSEVVEAEPIEGGNLDVTISSAVHAYATSPDLFLPADAVEGEEVLGAPIGYYTYAAAVYGAQADDSVELDDGADIVGDINLGGGANELKVIGNSIMEGNILSTSLEWIDGWLNIDNGAGTVDFDVDSGFFTAVRTVEVSDLLDTLVIGASGGLAPILSQDPDDGDTSLISVYFGNGGLSGDVLFEAGSTILPVFDDSVDLNNVVGNEYAIVRASEGFVDDDGAIVDNSETPFEYVFEVRDLLSVGPTDAVEGLQSIIIGGEEGILTVVGAKDLDEEETPGTVQTNQAVNSASQAVMIDISKHAALLRTLLRSSAQAPTGASGPEAEKMQNGEWLSYISVFGNIGQQETSGGFAGFDYDTYGLVVGQEKLVGEQLIVGIGGGYAQTDIDGLAGSGGGDSELYSLAVYANWFTDTWYAEGGLTYGHADSDVVRVDFKSDRYTGNYDSNLIGTWFELGYTSAFGDFGLEPYARATYIHGEHDGFTDSGPDALVLTTQDNETDNFKTEIGARLNHEWAYECGSSVLVEVKAAWEHEWGDEGVSVNSTYLGDSSLTLQSAEADTDAIVLGVRAQWSNGEGLAFGLEYEPTFAGNWYNHAFNGTLQYNW
ncbi:MAG: autotransporter domain-containing protein [Opitutaceae bacterium]